MSEEHESAQMNRRNKRLGFILLGISVALTSGFIYRYTVYGLPPDPDMWRRKHQRESALTNTFTPRSSGYQSEQAIPVKPMPPLSSSHNQAPSTSTKEVTP